MSNITRLPHGWAAMNFKAILFVGVLGFPFLVHSRADTLAAPPVVPGVNKGLSTPVDTKPVDKRCEDCQLGRDEPANRFRAP
jgi:hypothetical protein